MQRVKGIGTVELGLYIALAGLVFAAALVARSWIADHAETHYKRGLADKQLEWDKDKERAAELERQKHAALGRALLAEENRRLAAEEAADRNDAKWKEARRDASRKHAALASCEASTGPAEPPRALAGAAGPVGPVEPAGNGGEVGGPAPAAARAPAGGTGIRLHWRFVGLFDSVYTGLDGQPLSRAAVELAAGAPGAEAPSPYGLGELLEVHGDNARGLSKCRRDIASVRTKVEKAVAAWDAKHQ
jgi:hypothetical protein